MIGRRRGEDACGLYRGPGLEIDRLNHPDGSPRLHNSYRKGSSPRPRSAQWPEDKGTDAPFSVVSVRKTREIPPGKSTLRLPSINARVRSGLILSGTLYPTPKGSVLGQKSLYFDCHSGLDPESSISELDSCFDGNDGFQLNVKKC